MMMMMNTNSLGTSPTDSLTLGDGITQVTADTGSTILCSVKLTRFLTCCNYIPHVTTSSSDCPIVFIYTRVPVSVNYSLMKAVVLC